jgi:hypothetical protein
MDEWREGGSRARRTRARPELNGNNGFTPARVSDDAGCQRNSGAPEGLRVSRRPAPSESPGAHPSRRRARLEPGPSESLSRRGPRAVRVLRALRRRRRRRRRRRAGRRRSRPQLGRAAGARAALGAPAGGAWGEGQGAAARGVAMAAGEGRRSGRRRRRICRRDAATLQARCCDSTGEMLRPGRPADSPRNGGRCGEAAAVAARVSEMAGRGRAGWDQGVGRGSPARGT